MTLPVLMVAVAAAGMVDVDQGARAGAGDRAVSPSAGLSIEIPAAMQGAVAGEALVVESTAGSAVKASLSMDPSMTHDLAIQAAQQGFALGTSAFTASGQATRTGNVLELPLEGGSLFGGSEVGRAHVRTGFSGGTLTLLVWGPQQDAASVNQVFGDLVRSLEVYGAPPSPKPASSGASGSWAESLNNTEIRQANTGGGVSHQLIVDLCADGTAWLYQGGSYGSAGGDVSGGAQSSGRGTWSVQGSMITSRWSDGSTDTRELSWGTNDELLLDGSRWLRQASKRCQ